MVHLGASELGDLLRRVNLVALLQAFTKLAVKAPLRQRIDGPGGRELLLMPAISSRFAGVKILTVTAENVGGDLPSIQGLYSLFDLPTGLPLATIDASALTGHRTAAVSAAAANRLAMTGASRLTLLGSGHLVPFLCSAFLSVRPIREVRVWSRNADRCRQMTARLARAHPGLRVSAALDLEEAVGFGDIVCSATRATAPLIRGEWLRGGAHVDLVGGYRPDMREIDDDGIRRSRIFVDTLPGALAEAGDLIEPLRTGVITLASIKGDLSELLASQSLPRLANEITLFKSVGTAAADLIVAAAAWDEHSIRPLAVSRGLELGAQ